jgi:hypothetical protein
MVRAYLQASGILAAFFYGLGTPQADVINGGFESGDLTGWQSVGHVTVEMEGSIAIAPPEGDFEALVWNRNRAGAITPIDKVENALGLPKGTLECLSTTQVVGGSAMQQTFMASAGETLSFHWAFSTYRDADDPVFHHAFAFVVVKPLVPKGHGFLVAKLADTTSPAPESAGGFFTNVTPFSVFSHRIPRTDSYTVSLGIVDAGDDNVDAGLVVDDVTVSASPATKALRRPAFQADTDVCRRVVSQF